MQCWLRIRLILSVLESRIIKLLTLLPSHLDHAHDKCCLCSLGTDNRKEWIKKWKSVFLCFLWLKQTFRVYFITYTYSRALNYFPQSCFKMQTQLSLCLSLPSSSSSFYIPQSIFIFSHSAHSVLPHHFSYSLMGDHQNPSSKTLLVLSLQSFPINSLCWSSFLINKISYDTVECRTGSILINTMLCKNDKKKEWYEGAYKNM